MISTALNETDSVPDTGDEAMTNAALVWDSLYPILKEKYPGQYVAVYQGRVVDVDENALTLNRRLQKEYPNKSVWVGQIEEQPFPEIHMRSPHIER